MWWNFVPRPVAPNGTTTERSSLRKLDWLFLSRRLDRLRLQWYDGLRIANVTRAHALAVCQSSSACSSAYQSNFGSQDSAITSVGGVSAITVRFVSSTVRPSLTPASAPKRRESTPLDNYRAMSTYVTATFLFGAGGSHISGTRSFGLSQNPTIHALYPGKTTLNILRNLDPSNTLAANVSSYGAAGSANAQLWYDGEEEFFCNADKCEAKESDGESHWTCHDLKCTCRTNAAMCGRSGVSLICCRSCHL